MSESLSSFPEIGENPDNDILRGAENAVSAFMKAKGFSQERKITAQDGSEVGILDAVMESVRSQHNSGVRITPELVALEVRYVLDEIMPGEKKSEIGSMHSGAYSPRERNQGEWDREFMDFLDRNAKK
ncbi:hypothetical protein HY968_02970 [Candidatus Kaiserbacteria bacterium]|nr:hypothetical protein [Candidatus Kaiserbacteria bacterium]